MLYDQAQLAVAYSTAYVATKDPLYADIVRDILAYVNRDLSDKVNFGEYLGNRCIIWARYVERRGKGEILYILESNPHLNLIHTSFCQFLKRKKR
jgi:hypothetical protein